MCAASWPTAALPVSTASGSGSHRWEAAPGARASVRDRVARGPARVVPDATEGSVPERLEALIAADDSPSVARHLAQRGTEDELRELLIHRSADRLKEADPHVRVIPRLPTRAKAAMVEVLADEYGGGRPEYLHAELYRQALEALGLDGAYGAYVDRLPGVTLATVNLMSMFGAHARWRGAIAGHLAVTEMTSSEANRRYGRAVRRLGYTSREATLLLRRARRGRRDPRRHRRPRPGRRPSPSPSPTRPTPWSSGPARCSSSSAPSPPTCSRHGPRVAPRCDDPSDRDRVLSRRAADRARPGPTRRRNRDAHPHTPRDDRTVPLRPLAIAPFCDGTHRTTGFATREEDGATRSGPGRTPRPRSIAR